MKKLLLSFVVLCLAALTVTAQERRHFLNHHSEESENKKTKKQKAVKQALNPNALYKIATTAPEDRVTLDSLIIGGDIGDYERWEFTYTFDGLEVEVMTDVYYLEEGETIWEKDEVMKEDIVFDENGNVLSVIFSDDYEGSLSPWHKATYTYNESGEQTSIEESDYDEGEWEPIERIEYTYNESGELSVKSEYYFTESSEKELAIETTFSYENDLLMTKEKEIHYSFDYPEGSILHHEYTYNASDQLTDIEINYEMGGNGGEPTLYTTHAFEYTEGSNEELTVEETIHHNMPGYVSEKTVTTYDANGNEILTYEYMWDNDADEWQFWDKMEASYNLDYLYDDLLVNQFVREDEEGVYFIEIVNMLLGFYFYEDEETTVSDDYYRLYYSEGDSPTTSVATATENTSLDVYPNPASEVIYISEAQETGQLKAHIYNMRGECVLEREASPEGVSISSLQSGVYVLRVTDQNGELRYADRCVIH